MACQARVFVTRYRNAVTCESPLLYSINSTVSNPGYIYSILQAGICDMQ